MIEPLLTARVSMKCSGGQEKDRICYAPEWCRQHEACALEVRLRWRKGRRRGFAGNAKKAAPRTRETASQFAARVRSDEDAFDLLDGSASV